MYKNKKDVQEYGHCKGITLMNHTMKVWEEVIEKNLREETAVLKN